MIFFGRMGRDVTGLRIDKKSIMVNDKSNGSPNRAVHVAPKALPENSETNEEQDVVLGVESTNDEPEEKIIKPETKKSTNKQISLPAKPESGSASNETAEKQASCSSHANGVDDHDSSERVLAKSHYLDSPKSTKKSQSNAHFMSGKQLQPNHKNYYDEEDNWSLASSKKGMLCLCPLTRGLRLAFWQANANAYAFAFSDIVFFSFLFFLVAFLINLVVCYALAFGIFLSICSTATSVRNKITVPVAPRFSCVDRLDRRKEFYTKLEEKHKALEKEKLDYEARTKEEEQAAIKQLRKSMVVKAKPVPSFYREGPPPKVELKKLPVTRAKSPNLTRRKSCGDAAAVKPSPEDKGLCGRASRHSVGIHKEGKASPVQKKPSPLTPKSNMRKLNGSKKVNNQSKDTTDSSHGNEHGSADISVES
ncbi:hypothetical protein OROGR_020750 [Orobanche gracilis]